MFYVNRSKQMVNRNIQILIIIQTVSKYWQIISFGMTILKTYEKIQYYWPKHEYYQNLPKVQRCQKTHKVLKVNSSKMIEKKSNVVCKRNFIQGTHDSPEVQSRISHNHRYS